MSEPEKPGGWIPWKDAPRQRVDGPVAVHRLVEVRFRDGDERTGSDARPAKDWVWSHGNYAEDIIAYRIVSPSEASGRG